MRIVIKSIYWQQVEKPVTLISATFRDNLCDFANAPFLFNSVGF